MDDMTGFDPMNTLQWVEATFVVSLVFQIVMIILAVVVIIALIYGLILLRQFLKVYKANSEKMNRKEIDQTDWKQD